MAGPSSGDGREGLIIKFMGRKGGFGSSFKCDGSRGLGLTS